MSVGILFVVSPDKILNGLIHIRARSDNFSPPLKSVIQAGFYFRRQIMIEDVKSNGFIAEKFCKSVGFIVFAVILHVKNSFTVVFDNNIFHCVGLKIEKRTAQSYRRHN